VTAHAHLALREMIRGRYANYFWVSVLLGLAAFTVVPMPMVGVVVGMLGLLAFEHAYVQAGQSVPLA
jgi:hypothetical protein